MAARTTPATLGFSMVAAHAPRSATPSPAMYMRCSATTSASGIAAYAVKGDASKAIKPKETTGCLRRTTMARAAHEARTRLATRKRMSQIQLTGSVYGSMFRLTGTRNLPR
jgi:hypothetical protein